VQAKKFDDLLSLIRSNWSHISRFLQHSAYEDSPA